MLGEDCAEKKRIYPHINNLCEISDRISAKVIIKAFELNMATTPRVIEFLSENRDFEEVVQFVKRRRWEA